MTSKSKNTQPKSFADISKHIESKYKDRYDVISMNGLKTEMQRLRDMQETMKAEQVQVSQQQTTEQFFNGGFMNDRGTKSTAQPPLFNMLGSVPATSDISGMRPTASMERKPDFSLNANVDPFSPKSMDDRVYGVPASKESSTPDTQEQYGRDPLMYASALGPLAALMMNKKTPKIDRSGANRFVSTGKSGVGNANPRQTEFQEVSMSPIERALSERARGFSGANAQVSGGNAGSFMANELANQVNVLGAQGQASLGQQQMNTQIAGMNAGEQGRIDQFKSQNLARTQQAEQINASLALQYDDIDDRNEGAFRTNQSNAVQGIFQNLGTIGKENTQNNIILKALGYDEMGNYGGEGKNSMNSIFEFFKKNIFKGK